MSLNEIRPKVPNQDWEIGAMMMFVLGLIALYIGYSDPTLSALAYPLGIASITLPILVFVLDRKPGPYKKSEVEK